MNLENAIVYDLESFPNFFSLNAIALNSDADVTFVIAPWRDDSAELVQWLRWFEQTQTPMIGFNNVGYDYPMLHHFYCNPSTGFAGLYEKNQSIIFGNDRFAHTVWASDRFAPQIDLYRINHFDNKAKSTSLKALQFAMRSASIVESEVPFGQPITQEQADRIVIPYNKHDTGQTKQFAHVCKSALDFRIGMIDQFGVDVMNWNDTKIGEEMLIKRIGPDVCYRRSPTGRREKRQTVRSSIALSEIIFPYVYFNHPEFNRVLDYLKQQTLTPDEFNGSDRIVTKGVFNNLKATIDGFDFCYGLGGIHGSRHREKIIATDEWLIRDIDVASLYPSIGIVNRMAPEHLGEAFTAAYSTIPTERKEWQQRKGKKCQEANSLKLAANGAYGKTNDQFSVLLDARYTMQVTVNGQLLLSMLAEWLLAVPTLRMIQINTDGITYYIHRDHLDQAKQIEKQWEEYTLLVLEDASYSRMWIRDVGSYVAESPDGSLKMKGAYWHPDPMRYHDSINEQQPSAWHKDHSCYVVQRAAVAAMVHGIDPATYVNAHTDPFDFMLRAKCGRADQMLWGDEQQQRITRYYIAKDGKPLAIMRPPSGPEGAYKRKNGLTDHEYHSVLSTLSEGQWDARIHTGNRSRYETRRTAVQAGHSVAICNNADEFDWSNLNRDWYINEARKLIID